MNSERATRFPNSGDACFRTIEDLRGEHARLQRQRADEGERPQFVEEVRGFLQRCCETGSLLAVESERYVAQDILNYWAARLYRAGYQSPDVTLAEYDEAQAPALDDDECPYAATDKQCFVAWQRLIHECLGKLSQDRVVAVMGPAGSGRSSLIRSGLIAALKAGGLPESENWRILPVMTPGTKPLETLARVLLSPHVSSDGGVKMLAERFSDDPNHLAHVLDELGSQSCVLIIDRFEELFTLSNAEQRKAFVANLIEVLRESAGEHFLILSVRSDFLSHLSELKPLYSTLELDHNRVQVSFTVRELRQAIEAPAKAVGLKFDDGLVDRLLLDVQGDPAPLELLQFTLLQLWEHRQQNRISWKAYEQVGGGALALQRLAQAIYDDLTNDEQKAMQQILLGLVHLELGREVSLRTATRDELLENSNSAKVTNCVLDRLIAAQLVKRLTADQPGEDTYSLAHTGLTEHWPRLTEWLEDKRLDTRSRRRFTAAAEHWQERKKVVDALWSGSLLVEALQYTDLSGLERSFVQASQRRERWLRRRQLAMAFLIFALLLVITIFGFLAFYTKQNLAQRQSKQLAQANQALESGDISGSLLLFTDASQAEMPLLRRLNKHNEELYDLRFGTVLDQLPRLKKVFPAAEGEEITDAVFDEHNRVLMSCKLEEQNPSPKASKIKHKVVVGYLKNGTVHPLDSGAAVDGVWYSEHGSCLVTAKQISWLFFGIPISEPNFSNVCIWNMTQNEPVRAHEFVVRGRVTRVFPSSFEVGLAVVFSDVTSDNHQSGGRNSASYLTEIWDWSSGTLEKKWKLDSPAKIMHAYFSKASGDNPRLATATNDDRGRSNVQIWNARTGELGGTLEHNKAVRQLEFSPNGNYLLTVCDDYQVRLWEKGSWSMQQEWYHEQEVIFAGFSPDNRLVVTTGDDGTVRFWDVATGEPLARSLRHKAKVFRAEFSPDGRYLITASRDGTARVWSLVTGELVIPPLNHVGSVTQATFNRKGNLVLSQSPNSVRVWELATGNPPPALLQTEGRVRNVALSRDGSQVVVALGDLGVNRRVAAVYDAESGQEESGMRRDGSFLHLSFGGPDGRRMVTVDEKSTTRVWDLSEKTYLSNFESKFPINGASLSPDGRMTVSFGGERDDGQAVVWNTEDARPIGAPLPHKEDVLYATFHPLGQYVVTCCRDDRARGWQIRTLASTAGDGEFEITPWTTLEGHSADVVHASFSCQPNSKRVVTSSLDRTARTWKWEQGKPESLMTFEHPAGVTGAWFIWEDQFIATICLDGRARIWDAKTGEIVAVFNHVGELKDATFVQGSPDQKGVGQLVTVSVRPTSELSPSNVATKVNGDVVEIRKWNLSYFDGKFEHLTRLAKFVSAREAAKSGLTTLKDPVRDLLRKDVISKFFQESERYDHDLEAKTSEALRQWFAADWHLSELIRDGALANNEKPALFARRANARFQFAKQTGDEDWLRNAISDYEIAVRASPDNVAWVESRALCHLHLGDILQLSQDSFGSEREWAIALKILKDAKTLDPTRWQPYRHSAEVRARALLRQWKDLDSGQWKEVEKDLAEAILRLTKQEVTAVEPYDEQGLWYQLALTQLASNNTDAYQVTCEKMLDRFGRKEVSAAENYHLIANNLAWTCLLSDSGPIDKAKSLAEGALDEKPRIQSYLNTMALALYRSNRPHEAYDKLQESKSAWSKWQLDQWRRLAPEDKSAWKAWQSGIEDGAVWDWMFLAMVCEEIEEQKGESERWRALANHKVSVLEEAIHQPGLGTPWDTRLELLLLSRQMNEKCVNSQPLAAGSVGP